MNLAVAVLLILPGCGSSNNGLTKTGRALDLAIDGSGYFELVAVDGTPLYTRSNSFQLNKNGLIVSSHEYALEPSISIPDGVSTILVSEDGTVSAQLSNQNSTINLGQLTATTFPSPGQLSPLESGLFRGTAAAGTPSRELFGGDKAGNVKQGFLDD